MNADQKRYQLQEKGAEVRIKRVSCVQNKVEEWIECWDGAPTTFSAGDMDNRFIDHILAAEVFLHLGFNVRYFHTKSLNRKGKYVPEVMYTISL